MVKRGVKKGKTKVKFYRYIGHTENNLNFINSSTTLIKP